MPGEKYLFLWSNLFDYVSPLWFTTHMLYNLQALKDYTGFEQEARIIAWLNYCGIKWVKGKGGQPLTTLTWINAAFGDSQEDDDWELAHGR